MEEVTPHLAATEEFTGETSAANIANFDNELIMSTYREIHGRAIRSVSTDPTAEVTEGEIWYNTNSDTFKSVVASRSMVKCFTFNYS